MADKRVVFYSNESFYDRDSGMYVVARVVEDEAGYEIWARLSTLAAAQLTAQAQNEATGIDDDTVLDVVMSSMRASNLRGR